MDMFEEFSPIFADMELSHLMNFIPCKNKNYTLHRNLYKLDFKYITK